MLFLFIIYITWDVCDDCLTCDIAFNAVMSLSRASTRGSYSRIEGVTSDEEDEWGRMGMGEKHSWLTLAMSIKVHK